jgi:glyoxylase-like metal-dependent hydrolase (beta-lactamase superfamily II)
MDTATAISPDSGLPWTDEGAWLVSPGIYRIPLPLPMDGLRAINVYAIEHDNGLTLIDGGWWIPESRAALDRALGSVGAGFGDIARFLVTHVHRDHYTLAAALADEYGAEVSLGAEEKPTLEMVHGGAPRKPFFGALRDAGAHAIADAWESDSAHLDPASLDSYRMPTSWLVGDHALTVGSRQLEAVHTPGHTPGHFVFVEREPGLLFAGDHVLPTITPSIGFVTPIPIDPLGSYMASLTKVRTLPDLRILPAHGPIASSSHARVDELLDHHDERLRLSLEALSAAPSTAERVARQLPWTRHERAYESLDVFNQGMAALETKAHLDLLVARGLAVAYDSPKGIIYSLPHRVS